VPVRPEAAFIEHGRNVFDRFAIPFLVAVPPFASVVSFPPEQMLNLTDDVGQDVSWELIGMPKSIAACPGLELT
jgi:hypothetical protein